MLNFTLEAGIESREFQLIEKRKTKMRKKTKTNNCNKKLYKLMIKANYSLRLLISIYSLTYKSIFT